MRGGQVAIVLPQRIVHDVCDDDGLSPIDGGAARADLGTDAHAVDGLCIGLGEARRRAVPQAGPVFVEQQDGAEYPCQLGFDEAR